MEPYVDFGRTLYTDNWYNSVQLAEVLNDRRTNLVGTLRKNRKDNPPEVIKKKLQKGEITAMKNDKNVVVMKWTDKRDVLMITTKHIDNMSTVLVRNKEIVKPKAVIDYNSGKTYIDFSDQMNSYSVSGDL